MVTTHSEMIETLILATGKLQVCRTRLPVPRNEDLSVDYETYLSRITNYYITKNLSMK